MKSGIELIKQERERQISEEGYTIEHDDNHKRGELAEAGACYGLLPLKYYTIKLSEKQDNPLFFTRSVAEVSFLRECLWPFWNNSLKSNPSNRIRELQKAGALIVAEIDRLQRMKNDKPSTD